MPVEQLAPLVVSFLLALGRVGSVFVFLPLPGLRGGPDMARVALAVSFTLALFPRWPAAPSGAAAIAAALAMEVALGVAAGLAVAFLMEAMVLAMQIVGLEAGFSYATMIDPATDADSGVLPVLGQLVSMLLFFAMGLDGQVFRALALDLEAHHPVPLSGPVADAVLRLGAGMFATAWRLALPTLALLVLLDLAMALLGRIHAQLQLLTLSFPVKMLAALITLGWTAVLIPRVLRGEAPVVLRVIRAAAGF